MNVVAARLASVLGAALACAMLPACGAQLDGVAGLPSVEDEFAAAATGSPEHAMQAAPSFCARAGDDAVRDVFCSSASHAPIRDLRDLQERLALEPPRDAPGEPDGPIIPPEASNFVAFVVALAHSTSLSGHLVSPINPRVILIGPEAFLAFQRGVQRVELAARVRGASGFNFYLVQFEQACNRHERGCLHGDLFTSRVEADWTRVAIRDDEELKNTPEDCRQCHQRGLEVSTLLMRELESPWTHFFEPDALHDPQYEMLPGVRGSHLVHDYFRAKGNEAYGGIAAETLRHTSGIVLQASMRQDQPLVFDAPRIEYERWYREPEGWSDQPQASPTWESAYEAFKRGEQLALPHFEARPTDPAKQAALSKAYKRYLSGELGADELPDLADIFPDDPAARARIGLQTEPAATAPEALIQACGSCHNDVLDQGISRARFNVDLARLSPAEIALAIDRIGLPQDAPGVMPPPEARQLDPDTRPLLIEYLRQQAQARSADPRLERAARYGMAGASPN